MSVTITVTPSQPVATSDVVTVDVAGADQSTLTGYSGTAATAGSPNQYPASPEVRYYLTFELDGDVLGKSYVFSTDDDGAHTFSGYIFPDSGSWTVRLNAAADDSSIQTQAVTVD